LSITRSSARRIEALVADLSSNNPVARESAIARLTLIGRRAVTRLITVIERGQTSSTRTAALRALEEIDDPRALEAAVLALDDPDADVALAAIGLARACLHGPNGADALDRLTAISLDRTRPDAIRLAALHAISHLDRRTLAPLLKSLATDFAAVVHGEATARRGRVRPQRSEPGKTLERAAEQGLPDEPGSLHRAIIKAGDQVSLSILLRIVEQVRDREKGTSAAARGAWAAVRAAAHVALANRASRLALYDLRESLENANGRLPIEFLTALTLIGDASCLPAMAAAYARSRDIWFRDRLVDVFRAVVKRERLTRRNAAMKKIQKRWPGAFEQLVG
jgi:HEAT repeat protein